MNKVILTGRLTADPEIRVAKKSRREELTVAHYSLAVQRIGADEADFVRCVAFGKSAEFAETYLKKGMKIAISGRIQTGSYENKEGNKVQTFEIVVENHEFCESKREGR